jgi:spore germination protein YaaH
MTRRSVVVAVLASLAVTSALVVASWRPTAAVPFGAAVFSSDAPATPVPIPIPGHEVYGYVPYWEMDDGIAEHLVDTDLTTLGLFSVTHKKSGALANGERGYRRITDDLGRRLVREAHERGVRVELVYTSFGSKKNAAFFGSATAQDRTIRELAELRDDLGVDGINVDVELLDLEDVPAYGDFVGRLRAAIRVSNERATVSVATSAGVRGTAMAAAASEAGADRIFLMGYDYHTAGSEPGASAPLGRRDGSEKDLVWSLDLYRNAGVPAERTILGLPLYGMSWPTAEAVIGAGATGRGDVWIPRRNLDTLGDPDSSPVFDSIEIVEVLSIRAGSGWRAVYFDSPASLTPKLALADSRGLAGAGFWAIGYERGLPGYTELIETFRAGRLEATPAASSASPTAP